MSGKIADDFDLEITEEERKRLSPEDLKNLEESFRKLKDGEIEVATEWNEDKFSAEGMHPVGEPIPDLQNKKGRKKSAVDDPSSGRGEHPKKPKP